MRFLERAREAIFGQRRQRLEFTLFVRPQLLHYVVGELVENGLEVEYVGVPRLNVQRQRIVVREACAEGRDSW